MVFNTLTLNSGCTLESPGEIVFMEMPGSHPREFSFLTKKKSSTRDSDAQLGLGSDLDDLECGKSLSAETGDLNSDCRKKPPGAGADERA